MIEADLHGRAAKRAKAVRHFTAWLSPPSELSPSVMLRPPQVLKRGSRCRVTWVRRQYAGEFGHRLGLLPLSRQCRPQVESRVQELGLQLQRLGTVSDRFVEPPQSLENKAEV